MAGEVVVVLVTGEAGLTCVSLSVSHTQTPRLGPIKWLSVSEKEGLTLPLRQQTAKSV